MNKSMKSEIQRCAAGINFRAAENCPELVDTILAHVSENPVDVENDRIYHLKSSLNPCRQLTGRDLYADTYKEILQNIRDNWDAVGDWTWPYRAMANILDMDEALKNCGL